MNAYLQSWSPKKLEASVGKDLSNMMKVGRTYGLDIDVMAVSHEIQNTMPIWFHRKSYVDRSIYNEGVDVVECLRNNHKINLVRQAVELGGKQDLPRHRPVQNCRCGACQLTREATNCKNPHRCYGKARDLLDTLHEKWDPRKPQPEDYETEQAPQEGPNPETVEFDSRITTHGTIADTFRIFTKGSPCNLHGRAPRTKHMMAADVEEITVYTDGSALNNGSENARAGAGIFFEEDDPRNKSVRIPGNIGRTNNVGEMVAIKEATEICPLNVPLEIRSDSQLSIDGLTKNLRKWEENGFLTVENGKLTQKTVSNLCRRKAKTSFTWVKGHAGDPGNEGADRLAGEASARIDEDEVNIRPNPAFILPGAKLQALTQSSAYKIIRKIKMSKPAYQERLARRATKRNMEYAKAAATNADGEEPTASKIWKSTKHKDVSRSGRFFLWMMIHGGYKIGNHWKNIPGHEEKSNCGRCDLTESMDHIMLDCDAPGQEEIWELASELWKLKTGDELPKPAMGQIMACVAIKRRDTGETRLLRILVSESAHLIWRLRNERVIQGKDPASAREIHNRWLKAINNRFGLDCAMTNEVKYGKRSIKKSLVQKTWSKVLKNEKDLPKDWTWETGVLVGIG